MKKYKVEKRLGRDVVMCYDQDAIGPKMTPTGYGFNFLHFCGSHRKAYTEVDVRSIVEWLNEREAGYTPREIRTAAHGDLFPYYPWPRY